MAYLLRLVQFTLGSAVLTGAAACGALIYLLNHQVIDFSALAYYNPGRPSIILDCSGAEWSRFALDRREPVSINTIPEHVINAFLAAEDWNFFSHPGISVKGIMRSLIVNITKGGKVQGASTITQQLVRLLFFDTRKTFKRKMLEQLYAITAERQFTKAYLLETYLNHVYFGCGIYGIQAAAQRFFGIDVGALTLAQAASLAAVMRSPSHYSPMLSPLSNERRRNLVLSNMAKLNFITQQECQAAQQEPLVLINVDITPTGNHVRETIRQLLEAQLERGNVYTDGLIIQTTLDRSMQDHAQASFKETIEGLRSSIGPTLDGGLIAMNVASGEIKALVGGYDFTTSKFNRALHARRQLGSIFKPILYAASLEKGVHFTNVAIDEPIEVLNGSSTWKPRNYTNTFDGPMTLAYALSHSNNIVAVKTFLTIGPQAVVQVAQRAGLPVQASAYPSLALGCIDVTVKEATGMFNVFANHGRYVEPHLIKWIKDRWGTKIYKAEPKVVQVLPARIADQVAKVLEHGFKRAQRMAKNTTIQGDVIAKTGTTNDWCTCWFAGSTPELTTVVYVGNDDNSSMGNNMFPIKTTIPIWMKFYDRLNQTPSRFIYDATLKEMAINQRTGKPAGWFDHANELMTILT